MYTCELYTDSWTFSFNFTTQKEAREFGRIMSAKWNCQYLVYPKELDE